MGAKEVNMQRRIRRAFTLVELLVVIGIIAVLISILLPALARARESARTIACASNLREIGQALAGYISENKGVFPASNFYTGLMVTSNGTTVTQAPSTPINGYVHWSSYLYGQTLTQNDARFQTTGGWEMFQCPSLQNGGVPPANTYAANSDGLANEATTAGTLDFQAPRLSYMLNEILTPRSVFTVGFRSAVRPYHFVKTAAVSDPSNLIMATEMWGIQAFMETSSLTGGGAVSNSRRPVSGISASLSGVPGGKPDSAYTLPWASSFVFVGPTTIDHIQADPSSWFPTQSVPPVPDSTLTFVGRNHGAYTLGQVLNSNQPAWDMRKTNFLYVDGHVETKHITDTVNLSQWGSDFYDLDPTGPTNGTVFSTIP
jgi:prepilin-type N-terminal cleavage/methylation domain-containing protein/prepilin-type processing-associated H-X9-DG protein